MADLPTRGYRKEGRGHIYAQTELWAEHGLVYIEDLCKDDPRVVTCQDIEDRIRALDLEAKRAATGGYADIREHLEKWVHVLQEVLADAKDQGDPMDPKIAFQKYMALRKQRRATVVKGMW